MLESDWILIDGQKREYEYSKGNEECNEGKGIRCGGWVSPGKTDERWCRGVEGIGEILPEGSMEEYIRRYERVARELKRAGGGEIAKEVQGWHLLGQAE